MKILSLFFMLLVLGVNTSLVGEAGLVIQSQVEISTAISYDPKYEKVTVDTFFSALQAQDLKSLATKTANTNLEELIDETRKSATGKFRSEQSAPNQQAAPKKDYLSILGQENFDQLTQFSKDKGIPDIREISDPKNVNWKEIAGKITSIRDKTKWKNDKDNTYHETVLKPSLDLIAAKPQKFDLQQLKLRRNIDAASMYKSQAIEGGRLLRSYGYIIPFTDPVLEWVLLMLWILIIILIYQNSM